jgi:hypothetical protein
MISLYCFLVSWHYVREEYLIRGPFNTRISDARADFLRRGSTLGKLDFWFSSYWLNIPLTHFPNYFNKTFAFELKLNSILSKIERAILKFPC